MSVNAEGSDKVTISLSKDFYDIDSIRSSAKEFSNLCSTEIKENERFDVVLESKGEIDIKILAYEFCNYVLASMKNKNIV